MNLSNNFNLTELLRSQTATRKRFDEQFDPGPQIIENLRALCSNILQPLREHLDLPLFISSGFRCARLNRAVGGAQKSQHLFGQAADLEAVVGITNRDIFEAIKTSELPFDQLIWEFGNEEEPSWVHVSFSERNRRQVIVVS
ncbi:D-Ala-D-Ala carboxypeptidase family metallohydrolase [Dyadobacter psychrophilus]|uniref:Peptidase M15 n=1 Tax=Dyadobacter psychrophilus TaxID=651661 RepID=A0A1T5D9A2_9BACT|nr:D-Ala-D-Ala carboxypeptidase family metallohydrolase [Dyadobacter psychrophilus]SKB68342.1 Peptidase M15 [Dyadobacter psychrophilus]